MDEEVFVVIVNEENDNNQFPADLKIKEELLDESEDVTKCLLDLITKQGQYVNIKEEDEDPQVEYLEDDEDEHESKDFITNNDDSDDDYIPWYSRENNKLMRKFRMRKPSEQISYVGTLKKIYRDDKEVIGVLVNAMRSSKPPEPPKDYYRLNGIMLKCMFCDTMSATIPAAGRHYQEKHGPRYLLCYACGADFRSTTNLYKHEKRCIAPHASIVLKARALHVGGKGRSRPYLPAKTAKANRAVKIPEFRCIECPSVFNNKTSLLAHQRHHSGDRPYQCYMCPSAYTSGSALNRHIKTHADHSYICDHCGRMFKVKYALAAHMDTHLPMKKHGCNECGKRYAQKYALELHVNIKHRLLPPPCACQICPKRYPKMFLLKEHMRKAHGMEIMTRKMFFKRLPQLSGKKYQEAKVVMKPKNENDYRLIDDRNTSYDQHDNCAEVKMSTENNENISEERHDTQIDDTIIRKEVEKAFRDEGADNKLNKIKLTLNEDPTEPIHSPKTNDSQNIENKMKVHARKLLEKLNIQTIIDIKRNADMPFLDLDATIDCKNENDSKVVVIKNDDIVGMKTKEAKNIGMPVDMNHILDQNTQGIVEKSEKVAIQYERRLKRKHKPKKIISM